MRLNLKSLYKFCIDLIYPNRCPCCGSFINWKDYLCSECISRIQVNISEYCIKCGKKNESCICSLGLSFDKTVFVTDYSDISRKGIYMLKDSKNTNFAWYCGIELGKKILNEKAVNADYIIPVPMKKRKRMARGYNQAEIIAKGIRYVTGIPINNKILFKNKNIRDVTQHTLNAEKRFENAEKAYGISDCSVAGKNIIICDDVLTTGYTINKCSELLKSHGAEFITAAVAATTNKRKEEIKNGIN